MLIALDPALPFFDTTTDDYRIDPTDGKQAVIIFAFNNVYF